MFTGTCMEVFKCNSFCFCFVMKNRRFPVAGHGSDCNWDCTVESKSLSDDDELRPVLVDSDCTCSSHTCRDSSRVPVQYWGMDQSRPFGSKTVFVHLPNTTQNAHGARAR